MQKKHLFTLILSLGLVACASTNNHNRANNAVYIENAKQNLAWQGTYQGIIPCAGCDGVATMLVLKPNLDYQMRTRMLGKEEKDRKYDGSFTWQPNNTHIELIPENGVPKIYRVTEEFLELTLPDGELIPSDDPDQYRLYKTY